MEVKSDGSVIVPAGKYILGDPCYAIPDEHWTDFLHTRVTNSGVGDVAGRCVLSFGTAYGDGTYEGSDGFEYGVDSGMIGLVPADLPGLTLLGRFQSIVTFAEPTRCWQDGLDRGGLHFGTILIATSEDEDDEACECCGRRG